MSYLIGDQLGLAKSEENAKKTCLLKIHIFDTVWHLNFSFISKIKYENISK